MGIAHPTDFLAGMVVGEGELGYIGQNWHGREERQDDYTAKFFWAKSPVAIVQGAIP